MLIFRPATTGEVTVILLTLPLLAAPFQILGLLALNNSPTDNVVFFIKINMLCFSTRRLRCVPRWASITMYYWTKSPRAIKHLLPDGFPCSRSADQTVYIGPHNIDMVLNISAKLRITLFVGELCLGESYSNK